METLAPARDRDVSSETFDLTAIKLSNKHFVFLSLESIEQYFDECNRKVKFEDLLIKLLSFKYLTEDNLDFHTCDCFVLIFVPIKLAVCNNDNKSF